MIVSFWTDERHEQLEELAEQKLTAGQIARLIGCTRNAVIGRARRTGVALLSVERHYAPKPRGEVQNPRKRVLTPPHLLSPEERAKGGRNRAKAVNINAKRQRARNGYPRPPGFAPLHFGDPKPEPKIEPFDYPGPGYLFLEIPHGGCKFYVSPIQAEPTLFCGLPQAADSVYCHDHCRMAYTPRPPARKRADERHIHFLTRPAVILEAAE